MTLIKLTRYYCLAEDEYIDQNIIPVYDHNRNVIANVPIEFYADASLEGSGKLKSGDGRIINVDGGYTDCAPKTAAGLIDIANKKYKGRYGYVGLNKDGTKYFTYSISSTPWGVGVHNKPLYPFISVAADPTIYPFGTVLYCPALKDMKLPDGETHAGYLSVDDVGSAITGFHCDWFVGYKQWQLSAVIPEQVEVEIYKMPSK